MKNTKYGETALKNEIEILSAAEKGDRNNTLYKVAASLGELVAGGELSEYRVRKELKDTSANIGLDQSEIKGTIESGLNKGKANPRTSDQGDWRNFEVPDYENNTDYKTKIFWNKATSKKLTQAQERLRREQKHPVLKQLKSYDQIEPETLAKFGCGIIEKWGQNWLAMPYQTGCQLYLRENEDKKIRCLEGSMPKEAFFGISNVTGSKNDLFIAKSPRETMLLWQEYRAKADIIGLASGEVSSLSKRLQKILPNYVLSRDYDRIVTFLDCDSESNAYQFAEHIKTLVPTLEVRYVNILGQTIGACKDITDCIREDMGKESFNIFLDHSIAVSNPEKNNVNYTSQAISLEKINSKPINWLHPRRIPLGKISIFAGDPDVGKSFLTLDIAARVSTGKPWPDDTKNKPGNVLLLSAEDGLKDTILPRLEAAGANMKNIKALSTLTKYHKNNEPYEVLPSLVEDFQIIEKEIDYLKPRLIIVDPINAYLPGIDTHRDAELRARVFSPLNHIAEKYNTAVICVMHLNKSQKTNSKYRFNGSIAYVAAARSCWLILNDEDDSRRKLMLPVKFNIGPKPDGLAFKIIKNQNHQPKVEWEEDPVNISANEALKSDSSSAPERDYADEFLIGMLESGPIPSNKIFSEAEAHDIAKRTLKRSKKKLGIKSIRKGNPGKQGGGQWYWTLRKS